MDVKNQIPRRKCDRLFQTMSKPTSSRWPCSFFHPFPPPQSAFSLLSSIEPESHGVPFHRDTYGLVFPGIISRCLSLLDRCKRIKGNGKIIRAEGAPSGAVRALAFVFPVAIRECLDTHAILDRFSNRRIRSWILIKSILISLSTTKAVRLDYLFKIYLSDTL